MDLICMDDDDTYSNVDIMGSLQGLQSTKLEKLEELYYAHARAKGFSVWKLTRFHMNIFCL